MSGAAIGEAGWVLPFSQIGAGDLPRVGGKGANLGEMSRAGFPVPGGFCITTKAYSLFVDSLGEEAQAIWSALDELPEEDLAATAAVGARIRGRLTAQPIPEALRVAIVEAWRAADPEAAWAVRSSATAEDLPDASFAGQQDTLLNVRGEGPLLEAVRACWASLFTDRAILYRNKNHFAHKDVQLSVVVQRMVLPEVSGILFTADPVSGHRHHLVIEASYGLGEALVSGRVSPDRYLVDKRSMAVLEAAIGDKRLAIRPLPEGGTWDEALSDEVAASRVLTDAQVIALAQLGARVEAHYGRPQDIEWCLSGGELFLVQSRPITSLYPLPAPGPGDAHLHAYFCFNHAQVMTDAMTALGIDTWRWFFPFGKGPQDSRNPYLVEAGGRLYMDLTPALLHPLIGRIIPNALSVADPIAARGLGVLRGWPQLRAGAPGGRASSRTVLKWLAPTLGGALAYILWRPLGGVRAEMEAFLAGMEREVKQAASPQDAPGARLQASLDRTAELIPQLFKVLPPRIAAGLLSTKLLPMVAGPHASAADLAAVSRAFDGNVTTEMDLAVGDLADVARRLPQVSERLKGGTLSLTALAEVEGGPAFVAALNAFLDRYGMRGPGEIDIGRPRWRDEPRSVMQFVTGNLAHDEQGEHRRHHQALKEEAGRAAERLVAAARRASLGGPRAWLTGRLIKVQRAMMALREHPKFFLVRIIDLLRREALATGEQLVKTGQLDAARDAFHLRFDEIVGAAQDGGRQVREVVARRAAELARFQRMEPPKLLTSDGESPRLVDEHRALPEGALGGAAASAGVVEGIARVVMDPSATVLHRGEILIAPFTDPGWTPLFINAAGLVMEVGGMMTHGSVVAREYGIPAVVCVPGVTRKIATGQRIRVNGDLGFVQILGDETGE